MSYGPRPRHRFQSTPPARGATWSVCNKHPLYGYFNPRPPRGGRLPILQKVVVENSDAGSVSEVYDLIMKHRMFIVGAADIPVRHCLCRAKGTGAVKKVLSKHEALVQCSAYLAAHDIETEAYSNTAAAAKFIAETRPEGVGAVCSAQAAEEYGLEIIAADIQNTDNNCTRFIVISREAVLPEDAEKISLCFSLPPLSLGMSKSQVFTNIILPQAVSNSIPAFCANAIFLIKETSVFSAVALADLMFVTKDLIGIYYKTDEALFMLVIAYLIILLPISLICSFVERRVRYAEYGD